VLRTIARATTSIGAGLPLATLYLLWVTALVTAATSSIWNGLSLSESVKCLPEVTTLTWPACVVQTPPDLRNTEAACRPFSTRHGTLVALMLHANTHDLT
jgi:hypothetical protein